MTQYMISVYGAPDAEMPAEDVMAKMYADVDQFNKKVMAAGAWVFGGGLHPVSSATVVKNEAGKVTTTDGPYAEAKEYLGGFWIIEAPDLDAALKWATEGSEACGGAVEVRPFQPEPEA